MLMAVPGMSIALGQEKELGQTQSCCYQGVRG